MSLESKMSVLSHIVVYAAIAVFLVLFTAIPYVFTNLTGIERFLLAGVVTVVALFIAIGRCSAWANNYRGE
jgi:hypothetical protein